MTDVRVDERDATAVAAVAAVAARGVHDAARLAHGDAGVKGAVAAVLDAVQRITGADLVVLFARRGDQLTIEAAAGELAEAPGLVGHRVRIADSPPSAEALGGDGPVVLGPFASPDARTDPLADAVTIAAPARVLLVPVPAGDQAAGMLVFVTRGEADGIVADDWVRAFSSLLSLVLERGARGAELASLRERLVEQNHLLGEGPAGTGEATRLLELSESKVMRRLVRMTRQVAITDAPVLITGETGTGKEVLARAIHQWSRRAEQPFVQINCGALAEGLIESELFGHRKGAFSGAIRDRSGRFRLADGGSLLLDEIGDLPPQTQVKLLRVLEEGTLHPVGSDEVVQVDVRVMAATNVDLELAVEEGRFREDLYYRLHVFPITLPPLRERLDDLPVLAEAILERIHLRTGGPRWSVSDESLRRMAEYSWPGNVRELVNTLERARVFAPEGGELDLELGGALRPSRRRKRRRTWPTLKEHERSYLERVLEKTGGKIYGPDGAAALLDLPPTTLQSRLKRLGLGRTGRK